MGNAKIRARHTGLTKKRGVGVKGTLVCVALSIYSTQRSVVVQCGVVMLHVVNITQFQSVVMISSG